MRNDLSKHSFDFAKILIASGILSTIGRQDYPAGLVIWICAILAGVFIIAGILLHDKDKDKERDKKKRKNKKK